jgi:hypothetical protein
MAATMPAMRRLFGVVRMVEQTVYVLIYDWYITLPTLIAVAVAVAYTLKRDPGLIDFKAIGGLAALFVFPVMILVAGVLYQAPSGNRSMFLPGPPHAQTGKFLVNAAIFCQLAVGLVLVWSLRRYIWVVSTVFLMSLEVSLAAAIISTMAITGVWL